MSRTPDNGTRRTIYIQARANEAEVSYMKAIAAVAGLGDSEFVRRTVQLWEPVNELIDVWSAGATEAEIDLIILKLREVIGH